MRRPVLAGLAGLSAAIYSANAQGLRDAAKGEALLKQQCQVCHQVGPGAKSGIMAYLDLRTTRERHHLSKDLENATTSAGTKRGAQSPAHARYSYKDKHPIGDDI